MSPVFDPREAEQQIIGCILLDPPALARVANIVAPTDFVDRDLGTLFGALEMLADAGKPIGNPAWLVGELGRLGLHESVRSSSAITKFFSSVVNSAHVVSFAEQLRHASRMRQLQQVASEFSERIGDQGADPDDLAGWLDSKLHSFAAGRVDEARSLGDFAAEALAEIESTADSPSRPGAMTGLRALDEVMGPIMPGELLTLAARTGNGKTALAMQIAAHNAERGRRSLFVSLEMKATELARRTMASWAEVDGRHVRSGRVNEQERERLRAAKRELAEQPIRLWAPPKATLADIRAQARHAKATGGLGLLIVDYIGLVRPSGDEQRRQRYEQVSAVSAGLKALAKELSVPVLNLAQLNREADGDEPRLSHLRESGAIEQDSDIVLLLHHPEAKGAKSAGVRDDESREVFLIVAKHRHGQVGRVRLNWHPAETRFSSPMSF